MIEKWGFLIKVDKNYQFFVLRVWFIKRKSVLEEKI